MHIRSIEQPLSLKTFTATERNNIKISERHDRKKSSQKSPTHTMAFTKTSVHIYADAGA